jgi:endonuclease III
MKNSKEYSKKIKNIFRLLRHTYPKVKKVSHENLIDALVYSIISEKFSDSATEAVMKRFSEHFVDLNDLRVSRAEEVIEMLGVNADGALGIPSTITSILQTIFNQYHKLTLDALKKQGKRQVRQALEKIEGATPFILDYCMLTSLDGHAIPLTEKMIEYLKNNDLVDAQADRNDIEGFLTKQIPAKEGYEFYTMLRQESEECRIQSETKKKTETKIHKSDEPAEKVKKKAAKKKTTDKNNA